LLPPDTARYYTEFTRCTGCGHIYWPGSHLQRVRELLQILQEGRRGQSDGLAEAEEGR
jgi:uncharacterized protein with PIN domain